ncbi:MAG: glycine cleavage system protein R [Deltaproteobacteria bacterium]|nr:glycine cleavage system protein R [Deltaproteobacteria bacterium]
MSDYAVLTAIGEDRPGLVDAISSFILQSGCNIEDSRMAILGGEFAMLILLSGEGPAVERVQAGAADAGHKVHLTVQVRRTRSTGESLRRDVLPYRIAAYSLDHPGIVQRVAHYLAEKRINIRAMETHVKPAPHSGQPLFSLEAVVDVPAGESVAELRRGLTAIGAEENIDFAMNPEA